MTAISAAAPNETFGTCVPDLEYCTNVRCTRDDLAGFQLSVISILPCVSPPAIRAFYADSELQAQIDVTITSTRNRIPFRNTDIGFLNILMEVNSDLTSIRLRVCKSITREVLRKDV